MKRFGVLLGIIVLTSLAFWPITGMRDGSVASTQVLGMPVLGVGTGEFCWLTLGFGTGVLFVGLAGAGAVGIGLAAGGGLLFGSGQVAAGTIAVGQLALGILFVIGQLGFGVAGVGQLIVGVLVKGQAELGKNGGPFLQKLDEDLNEALTFRGNQASRRA
jgi:hypothetical protein